MTNSAIGIDTVQQIRELEQLAIAHSHIPVDPVMQNGSSLEPLNLTSLIKLIPKRKSSAHKGDYGHVLVVGGDYGMGGAVRMAAEAAARVGAGLVTVATRTRHVTAINAARPELMCYGIRFPWQLKPLLAKATVVIVGPGLGQSWWSKSLWRMVLNSNKPLVVDADALNLLAKGGLKYRDNWILTPHPGEAARLLHTTVANVQADRLASVNALCQRYGGVSIIKGQGTLIAENSICGMDASENKFIPENKFRSNENTAVIGVETPYTGVCNYGNPGMSSGGMGDILSGIIGGLLAQGIAPLLATQLGVCLHAVAGDEVARVNGERGMLALDLLPQVRHLLNFSVATL